METLDLFIIFTWIVVSIAAIVKFFEMAYDVRALRKHFIKKTCTNVSIELNEKIHGTIRKYGDISYDIVNGFTKFSDGKTGYIGYLPNGKCVVPSIGDKIFDDVYYAVEALFESLNKKKYNSEQS